MEEEWTHCYRMRPYFRNVGLAVIALSGGMAIFSYVAWINQPANNKVKMPAVITGFLLFAALGIYLLLLYYRYRLFVNKSSLRQVGVLYDKYIDLSFVDELKWRRFPQNGSVRISGPFGVLRIELGHFRREERQQLTGCLRSSIAQSKQIGWQQFNEEFSDTIEE
jgi:hypothetical protein